MVHHKCLGGAPLARGGPAHHLLLPKIRPDTYIVIPSIMGPPVVDYNRSGKEEEEEEEEDDKPTVPPSDKWG